MRVQGGIEGLPALQHLFVRGGERSGGVVEPAAAPGEVDRSVHKHAQQDGSLGRWQGSGNEVPTLAQQQGHDGGPVVQHACERKRYDYNQNINQAHKHLHPEIQ